MGTPAGIAPHVIQIAVDERSPARALAAAEAYFMARRGGPAEVTRATREALAQAGIAADGPATRTALAVAELVERHGESFPPGGEPAYHDRHHQAEAVLAMGWLAGTARRLGLIGAEEATLAIAAMAGHDLLHDGSAGGPRGILERHSAEATDAIAAAEGLSLDSRARIGQIIIATTWPWEATEAPDLACRLAREADLFASSLPALGLPLARRLAREFAAAGQPDAHAVATHAARLALLRLMPPATVPAAALGLDAARAAQIAAYDAVAGRLGLASGEEAASALDGLDEADATALLAHVGRGA